MPSFDEVLAQHVATGFARQLALGDLLQERDWNVDISAGIATFGDDLQYPIQLLGTESEYDGTWLWAWANEESNLPPELLHLGGWLREYGRRAGIAELTEPTFPLQRADGHRLALVASGLTGRCYYRGPYDGGALFFHLENVPPELLAPVRPERAMTILTEVVQQFPVAHRIVVESFFTQQGWRLETSADTVVGHHGDGSQIWVTFDGYGRIARFNAQIGPR
jgi:hypothetical protein